MSACICMIINIKPLVVSEIYCYEIITGDYNMKIFLSFEKRRVKSIHKTISLLFEYIKSHVWRVKSLML